MDLSLMNRPKNSSSSASELDAYDDGAAVLRRTSPFPSSGERMLEHHQQHLHHNFIPVYQQQQHHHHQQLKQASIASPGHLQQHQQLFPFTASQWSELEHQALIFKYMVARAPIPPELLIPIRRSLMLSAANSNSAWGGFQMGGNPMDAEPGRCRRTDGKKWRCSKPVVSDQKYCERHMHRGRNRSRKAAQAAASKSMTPQQQQSQNPSPFQNPPPLPGFEAEERRVHHSEQPDYQTLKPVVTQSESHRKTPEALRHFFDEWPRESKEHSSTTTTTTSASEFESSISNNNAAAAAAQAQAAAVAAAAAAASRRSNSTNGVIFPPLKLALDDHDTDDPYTNISLASVSGTNTGGFVRSRHHPWFTDTPNPLGGPLAEALQQNHPGANPGLVKSQKPVGTFNLLDAQLSSRKQQQNSSNINNNNSNIVASPTGVLQKFGCFSDCSSSASSPGSIRTDNIPHSLAQVE